MGTGPSGRGTWLFGSPHLYTPLPSLQEYSKLRSELELLEVECKEVELYVKQLALQD